MTSLCEYYGNLDFSVRCSYQSRLLRSLFLWQSCISMIGIQRFQCELFCSFRIFLSEVSFLGRTFFFWPSDMTCFCLLSIDLSVPVLGRYLCVPSWGVTEWGVSALDTPLFSSTIRFCFRQFAGGHWCFFLHLSRPALSYLVLFCPVFSRRACNNRSLRHVFGSVIFFFGLFDSARLGLAWAVLAWLGTFWLGSARFGSVALLSLGLEPRGFRIRILRLWHFRDARANCAASNFASS
jgi:hypothetical protein